MLSPFNNSPGYLNFSRKTSFMDRRYLRDRVFRLLCDVADDLYGEEFTDLLLTVGREEEVRKHSFLMANRRELARRLDLPEGLDVSVYDENTNARLQYFIKGGKEKETDGSLIVTDAGKLDVNSGSRLLIPDYEALRRRKRRLEGGTGRNALAAISLLRGVAGYMLRESSGEVREYLRGRTRRQYLPESGTVKVFREGRMVKEYSRKRS
jgi:hypothetical protein